MSTQLDNSATSTSAANVTSFSAPINVNYNKSLIFAFEGAYQQGIPSGIYTSLSTQNGNTVAYGVQNSTGPVNVTMTFSPGTCYDAIFGEFRSK